MDRRALSRLTEAMSTSPYVIAAGAATISTAAVGGMFYIFSTMVMKGLDRTEPVEALAAMRGINAQANASAPFLIFFMGSTVLAAVVGVIAALRLSTPGSGYLLAGAVLSVLAFVVTMAFNVPLNNHLDGLDPSALSAADALSEWKAYLVPWTNWNHVRTVTPLVGSVLMLIGLRSLG
jgi:uncharacterized membrane protein